MHVRVRATFGRSRREGGVHACGVVHDVGVGRCFLPPMHIPCPPCCSHACVGQCVCMCSWVDMVGGWVCGNKKKFT